MKERLVTRKIVESKTYRVLTIENGETKVLEVLTTKGRVSTVAMAKKHGVRQVFLEEVDAVYKTYAMTVSDFMELARPIEEFE